MQNGAEDDQHARRPVEFFGQIIFLRLHCSLTDVEEEVVLSGNHGEDELRKESEDGKANGQEEAPKVILDRCWILQMKNENVPAREYEKSCKINSDIKGNFF